MGPDHSARRSSCVAGRRRRRSETRTRSCALGFRATNPLRERSTRLYDANTIRRTSGRRLRREPQRDQRGRDDESAGE